MEYAIIFLPLISSFISGFFGKKLGDKYCQIFACLLVLISGILSLFIFYEVLTQDYSSNKLIFNWISSGDFHVNWSIVVDPLTSVMLVVVSLISSIIHFYSIGYMSHDPHKTRFMAYLSLFTFAMLTLVTADNFLQLFFGWEGVGLCSYLLIGFWYKKPSANSAAIKAFVVNRVGDFGFAIGIFLIFFFYGTVNYHEVFQQTPLFIQKQVIFLGIEVNLITLICLLLFLGAMGKSAQIFLHTWLPDAMEGPTPVSALIHAATMVTAGVFLVVKCSPLFEYSQIALNVVATVGMMTAFFAATVALVQNDIKKIVAYSTCSQLGYMFFAAGVGAYHVAIFHLFTHAFFKALLFLGSGCVIHSFDDEQDIRSMGGVWKKIPYTYTLMVIGTLALTGFPFLSGYYSKDAIIEFAYLKGSNIGYYAAAVGIFTALLTAIYSWRLVFKTFHGKYNNKKNSLNSIHESSSTMLIPSCLLAVGAIVTGILFKEIFIGQDTQFWNNSILFLYQNHHDHVPIWLLVITPLIVILAIPIAYYLFVKNEKILKNLILKHQTLYNFLINKWYFDDLYNFIFVEPIKKIGLFFWKEGDVNIIDRYGPDGLSKLVKTVSDKAVNFQSGYLYHYAFVMLIGFSILLTYLILY
ncbi:MAG: NADH-quinone oxidoreductase subunit L [Pelagibacteraceae bacterium]|jgi:NADH-quinone oxidoreductase subunit L|nr:NADH-quinone oxidoreductase subunit L [Pelagibacteraceae bacterium]MDP6709780.1 NADH-quinone oxidoreductase subunit L [Pelagibacteraceae bacterium]|tara:strand:+ start:197 stop:2104 length:1908 start_codon:yes stop_codon:yes gene_type:complete